MADTWTLDQAVDKVGDNEQGDIRRSLEEKIASGRGIAIYENHDLGHPMLGHAVALTYGCPEAQFTGEPPQTCPDGLLRDITGGINWRYQLVGVIPPKGADDAAVS